MLSERLSKSSLKINFMANELNEYEFEGDTPNKYG